MSRMDIIRASIVEVAERLERDKELRREASDTEAVYRAAARRRDENWSEMEVLCESLDVLTSRFRFPNMSMPNTMADYKDVERRCQNAREDRKRAAQRASVAEEVS